MLGLPQVGLKIRPKCVASCALKLVQVENGFKKFGFSKRP
jgi:hypothetical protein